MSYSVTIETADGETKVTGASGHVPPKITVSGHVPEPGTSPPSIYVDDGTLRASAQAVAS